MPFDWFHLGSPKLLLMQQYADEIAVMLFKMKLVPRITPCGLMFFAPDDVAPVWVRIRDEHLEIAKQTWVGKVDPHGWSPSDIRTIAVIAPMV